jgi:glycosyltransferase involved in cell wall biosynthesis
MRKPVLTIFYQFNPWNSSIGGIQTLIRTFIKYAPSEFDVRLVGTANNSNTALGKWQDAELEGRQLQFMPLLNLENDDIRKPIPTTLKYTAALMQQHFISDFMHFHRLEPSLVAYRWSVDKTLFVHNDIAQQMVSVSEKNAILWRRFPSAYFTLERFLVPQFTQILSCNSSSTEHYRKRYPAIAPRVNQIRNSVDRAIFYPATKQERHQLRSDYANRSHLPTHTKFVLFAGRLHPQKDPLLLVESFAALDRPDVHLLIAGQGELANPVRSRIEQLNLTKRITLLGSLNQAELAVFHRLSHVFVLTSAYEGLPLVALEALASGTPVVTTDCGETPNLLTADSGVVSQERTPTAIAGALQKVLSNPQQFPTAACVRIAAPYGADRIMQDIYSDMLSRWQP